MAWSNEEKEYLREIIEGRQYAEISRMIKEKFGTDKKPYVIQTQARRMGIRNNVDTRFKKGEPSRNKGKKMKPETYEKVKPYMFKKGQKCHNSRPLLSEKESNGFIWVKVAENVWERKHRYLYEQYHNVKLTSDDHIIFLDGDHNNFDKENLFLVDKKTDLQMNTRKLKTNNADFTRVGVEIARMNAMLNTKRKELKNGKKSI